MYNSCHLSLPPCRSRGLVLSGPLSRVLIPRWRALHRCLLCRVPSRLDRRVVPSVASLLTLVWSCRAVGRGMVLRCPSLSVVVLNRTTLFLRFWRNPLPLSDRWHRLHRGWSRWQAVVRPTARASCLTLPLAVWRVVPISVAVVVVLP